MEDLINQVSSPCRILYAKRLNRRTTDPTQLEQRVSKTPNKTLQLRQIGGINRESFSPTNQWLNNTYKTYSRNLSSNNIVRRSATIESINNSSPRGSISVNSTLKFVIIDKAISITILEQPDGLSNKKSGTTRITILLQPYPTHSSRNLHNC